MAAPPCQGLLTDFCSLQPPPAQSKSSPSLPMELVVAMLDYLSFEDLRSAAAVCHQFKAAAYQHAGLYIQRTIRISSPQRAACSPELETFREVTQHAIQGALRVSLILHCSLGYGVRPADFYDEMRAWLDDVYICIQEALPVLVNLNIRIPQIFCAAMTTHLCHPAPHLVEFDVTAYVAESLAYVAEPQWDSTRRLPESMFSSAPKLAKIKLRGVVPGENPIPAFSGAKEVLLEYKASTPVIPLARHFPCLSVLSLNLDDNQLPARAPFDLRGLSLRRLAINDLSYNPPASTFVAADVNVLRNIPTVEYYGTYPNWCLSFWDSVQGKLHLRIRYDDLDDTHVTIVPEGNRLFRITKFDCWYPENNDVWTGLTSLSARFTYIRVDNQFVYGLLCTFINGMPALRHLQIDLSNDTDTTDLMDYQSFPRAPYPVLETVILFAMDEPKDIDCNQLTQLGQALGQQGRAPGSQPVVTLVGMTFSTEILDPSLPLVFPTINYRGFEGRGSPGDRDAGIWKP